MYAHTLHAKDSPASTSEVILYDLPSRGTPKCWSGNPWKARAALNFKGIPYKTQWIEYPDLASTFKDLGIPPNSQGSMFDYSSPVVKLPDGSYMMESRKIAEALDKLQPEPSLHTDKPEVIDKILAVQGGIFGSLAPIIVPRVPEMLLNPRSEEYFRKDRKERFGMSLEELAKSEKAGDQAWEGARPHMEALVNVLKEKEGPFILGREVGFADFVLGGFWAFMAKLDKEGDLFVRAMEFDPVFAQHWKAVQKWFERDD